jgi:hypothetical protein
VEGTRVTMMDPGFGFEVFRLESPGGVQHVQGDVYLMAAEVAGVYAKHDGLTERTEALNAAYAKYGLTTPLLPAAADKLASLIVDRGVVLKNAVWPTPNGSDGPGSAATTQG